MFLLKISISGTTCPYMFVLADYYLEEKDTHILQIFYGHSRVQIHDWDYYEVIETASESDEEMIVKMLKHVSELYQLLWKGDEDSTD